MGAGRSLQSLARVRNVEAPRLAIIDACQDHLHKACTCVLQDVAAAFLSYADKYSLLRQIGQFLLTNYCQC